MCGNMVGDMGTGMDQKTCRVTDVMKKHGMWRLGRSEHSELVMV